MIPKTRKNTRRIKRKIFRRSKVYTKKYGGSSSIIAICIYSHSSHFDVLQIQIDYLNKLFNGTNQKVYLFLDKDFPISSNMKFTTIIYDEKTAYTKRILYCIEQVEASHIIISQESDIIVKYNSDIMMSLTTTMDRMKIDSVDLVVRDLKCEKQEKISDSLFIMNLNGGAWHREWKILYTTQPRLWKKESAKQFFSSIGDLTYKEVENESVQKYITDNQTTYSLCSANPIMSFGLLSESFLVAKEYVFIHVTMNGKFVRKATEKNSVDPEIAGIEKEIYERYIEKSTNRAKMGANEKGTRVMVSHPPI